MKLLLIAGARPNFMKIAPLTHALDSDSKGGIEYRLVHTGQHYDYRMSSVFFDELDIPEPHYFLDAGSGSHAVQTARIMVEFEKVCVAEKPDMALVVGDVNSTLACSITARKMGIAVAHVEAGLRSRDMAMPEEINRIVTDSISDLMFVTEQSGVDNLLAEGRPPVGVHLVGNLMIDTLHYCMAKLGPSGGRGTERYSVVTLHRPSNVDNAEKLSELLGALSVISRDMPVHFPIHPRTRANIERFGLGGLITEGMRLSEPMAYMEFLRLWRDAALVITDSGGLQEETTALQVPCFTVRDNTERPVTVSEGTNTLVGASGAALLRHYSDFCANGPKAGRVPDLWDGRAAARILGVIGDFTQGPKP